MRSDMTRTGATIISGILLFTPLLAGCSGGGKNAESEGAHDHEETVAVGAEHRHGEEPGHEEAGHEEGGHEEEGLEEGRVVLPPETIAAAGILVETAGPHAIKLVLDLPGEVAPNADRLAHIVPRFPGIAREVKKGLGDVVQQGEVLAIVESNESLSPYEVRSLISGAVIEKHITLGEFVRDDADVFVVADLSTVWVNVTVYARDLGRVRKGQHVDVSVVGEGPKGSGVIDYIGSVLGETTRAATARVVISNPSREWRPGMFITATVVLDEDAAAVAVPDSALQRLEAEAVVFVVEDEAFEARPVSVGRTDGKWTEILSGLSPGERYVVRGGFLLKSELKKSEASHEH